MKMFAVWQIIYEKEKNKCMDPTKNAGKQMSGFRCSCGKKVRKGMGYRYPGNHSIFTQRYLTCMQAKVGYHKGSNQREDEEGI